MKGQGGVRRGIASADGARALALRLDRELGDLEQRRRQLAEDLGQLDAGLHRMRVHQPPAGLGAPELARWQAGKRAAIAAAEAARSMAAQLLEAATVRRDELVAERDAAREAGR